MKVLFLFLDGVGLGENNPQINPFAKIEMPALQSILGGRRMLAANAPFFGEDAALLPLDASLGVDGIPQSASGQASLLTGRNVPKETGEHYGPKPNEPIREIILENNVFKQLTSAGKKCALINAYPARYFESIGRGKRLYSAIPLAVTSAGLSLFTTDDFYAGRAMSADFTGEGWRTMLNYEDAPLLTPREAGAKLAQLSGQYDFSMFEYWASDYAGHGQDMPQAEKLLETLDGVFAGLVEALPENLLVLVTSDHGNMEDLSTRRHTLAKVPGLVIGPGRERFCEGLSSLTDVADKIIESVLEN